MPRVYILPDLIVHDYDVPKTFYPYTAKKYKQISGDGSNSHHDYTLYMDGVEIPKKRYVPSMGGEIWHYGKSSWGLFSIDVEPGEHTITIDARQESFYSIDDLGIKIGDRPRAIRFYEPFKRTNNKFKKEITFNIIDENVFLHFILEFEQYYPVVYCVNGSVYAPSNNVKTDGRYVWWCDKDFRYSINTKFSFQQINYGTMKGLMDVVMKGEFAYAYNEPMPEPSEEDIKSTRSVKSSTGHSSIVQTKSNGAQSVKIEQKKTLNVSQNSTIQANSSSAKPLSIAEQAKAQGKTIAQFIGDRPEPIKPRKRIVKKEVIVKEKYYDSEKFEESMEGFEYQVSGDEVILTKVLKSCVELVIPDGVTVIKENALGNYLDSEIIKLPYSLKVLEKGAFKSNTRVQKVVLESQIDTIEEETFMDCKNLQEVILPPTVKSIKSRAFQGAKLKSILVRPDILIEKDAFDENVILDDGSLSESEKENLVIDGFITELLAINPKKGEFVSKLQSQLKSVEEKESANFEVFKVKKEQEFIENKENYIVSKKIKSLQEQIQELELQIDALSKN